MTTDAALMVHALGGGGVERMRIHLARALTQRHLNVDLVVARNVGVYSSSAKDVARVIDLDAHSWQDWLIKLVRYLRRERPTVLLSAMDVGNLIAIWARQLSRAPTRVVIGTHNTLSIKLRNGTDPKERILLVPLMRLCYRHADRILAISNGVAEDLARLSWLPRERIEVIHNPVVTTELCEQAARLLNGKRAGRTRPPSLLAVGRLVAQKDFATLIRAFARVQAQTQARLIILGEGPDRAALESLAHTLGIREHVELTGFVPDVLSYMSRASVFVLSSAWEGFGNVIVEALACGCPVVSTDCPSGPREILEDGKYGRLVPVGDDAALAQAIVATLENPPDPDVLIMRAMDFHVDRIIERYLAVTGLDNHQVTAI